MAELKTKPNDAPVAAFIAAIDDERRRADCLRIIDIMQSLTASPPQMWGTGIVGFGKSYYLYDSGHGGDWFLVGFASRKAALTIYLMSGLAAHEALLTRLGKHKTGKGCLYLKSLADVDEKILRALIKESIAKTKARYPGQ